MTIYRLDPDQHPWMKLAATVQVMQALGAKQDQVRFVGGCVRNALQGRDVDDIDIATVLRPDEVMARCEAAGLKPVPTGLDHGTITVVSDHKPHEVTTLRRDVSTDGRRAVVAFTTDWNEDAARRDFRLNAIYAGVDGEIFDPENGVEDALQGRVVFIGRPEDRLAEDYLRLLRFYRFNAWYGDQPIDPAGHAACKAARDKLWTLSAERIWMELKKLLNAPDPTRVLAAMNEAGILESLLGFQPEIEGVTGLISQDLAMELKPDPVLRLASLCGPEDEHGIELMARLKVSNVEKQQMTGYSQVTFSAEVLTPDYLKSLAYQSSIETVLGQVGLSAARGEIEPNKLQLALDTLTNWTVPVFPVRGQDLTRSGLKPGPQMGETLSRLEQVWIESGFTLTRHELLERL